jgi:hypothetical protein
MLWNTLIRRAEKHVMEHPEDSKVEVVKSLAKKLKLSPWLYLSSITPQQVDDLRRLLPEVFPKKLQRLPLKVSQNIHGKWRVDATNKEPPQ